MILQKKPDRLWVMVCILISAIVCVALINLLYRIDIQSIFKAHTIDHLVLWNIRLPRALTAICIGALLGLSGVTIQSLFNNPLAEPGLLGLSGGASLFAALALFLALSPALVSLMAFVGALLALGLCQILAGRRSNQNLILAGVALNAIFGSILTLLISLLPEQSLKTVTFWLMGSLADTNWQTTSFLACILPLCFIASYKQQHFLNALKIGEEGVFYLGYNLKRQRFYCTIGIALASGVVAAIAGMIGFVGLMAPHLTRLFVGNHTKRLIWGAPLMGALLTLGADTIASQYFYPAELPIGVITSLIGAPFFLWLMRNNSIYDHG